MGGRERNHDPAFQTFVTGVNAPSAEEGKAFFSPRLLCGFLYFNAFDVSSYALTNYIDLL